jgi:hypothetical protein
MNTQEEKYLKSSGLWSFSVVTLAVFSFLFFIPMVVLISDPESLRQQVFEYLMIIGTCTSMVLPFVEIYFEGKYRKNGDVSHVIFWRNFALYHWLAFSLLVYLAFTTMWS